MFNWLQQNHQAVERLSARKSLRTIRTARDTAFDVFAETDHFIMCFEPENRDTPSEALLDIEDMAGQGYWLCYAYHGTGAFVVFEKRPKSC